MKKLCTLLLAAQLFISPLTAWSDCLGNFCLPNKEGKSICRSDMADKVVFIDFWTSWCPNCRASLEWLSQNTEKFPAKDLAVLAINLDENRSDADEALKEIHSNAQFLFDNKGEIAERCNLPSIPYAMLLGKDGKVVQQWSGDSEKNHQQIIKHLEELSK